MVLSREARPYKARNITCLDGAMYRASGRACRTVSYAATPGLSFQRIMQGSSYYGFQNLNPCRKLSLRNPSLYLCPNASKLPRHSLCFCPQCSTWNRSLALALYSTFRYVGLISQPQAFVRRKWRTKRENVTSHDCY